MSPLSPVMIAAACSTTTVGEGGDEHFASVSLLALNESAADAGTSFDDASANNHTLTTVGNAVWDDAQAPTGQTTSMLSDGSGDGVTAADHASFDLADGDFTVEGWVRFSALGAFNAVVTKAAGATTEIWLMVLVNSSANGLAWWASSADGSWDIASEQAFGAVTTDTWYHFALVREGDTWTPYLNGTAGAGVVTSSATLSKDTGALCLGRNRNTNAGALTGWLASVRITKGVARYTENFTPPELPLPTE